ncbi:hypothetical protein SXCC_01546 [Gluconacetobacter sp. SXCC-1]|nr:hypothetical protein SXCC_01546 [Gluconacetobacter sp. SXCC-1]
MSVYRFCRVPPSATGRQADFSLPRCLRVRRDAKRDRKNTESAGKPAL